VKMIERWMIRRLQKMCREKSNCDARCPASLFAGMAGIGASANTCKIPAKRPYQNETKCFVLKRRSRGNHRALPQVRRCEAFARATTKVGMPWSWQTEANDRK